MAEKAAKGDKKKQAENVLPLFGASIEEAAKRSDREHGAIPLPIKSAVEYLNQRGLKEEGLYRVPGNAQKFAEYKQQFDEGKHVDFIALDERSPENVAMVIVKYLQMLPDPLLTRKWEQHFKVALGIDSSDPKERYHVIRAILLRLPYANRETVRILALHLKQVAQHSDKNKMTARNIELTWSLSVGAVVGAVMRVLVETEAPPPSTIVFGLPVLDACKNSEIADSIGPFVVPAPISRSWEWFRQKNSWSNDLFTKFSDTEIPALLKSNFNSGNHTFPENATGLDVATFVRDFIIEIPESIFTDKLHDDFGAVADLRTPADQVARLRDLFSQLHPVYRHTLKCFTQFLVDIMGHSTTMSSFSIAFAFGDRYVDKIPLLIDNVGALFGPETDVTQLPWFDISKAPSQSPSGLVSFSIGGATLADQSDAVSMTFSVGETSTNGTPKPKKPREKRSKHAADSPGAPVQRTSSGKLKRVKSEAELGGGKIKKTSKRTVMSHESDTSEPATPPVKREKKKTHDKVKSEDVRPKMRDLKKKTDDADSNSSPSRPHKKRAGSDTSSVKVPSTEEQQSLEPAIPAESSQDQNDAENSSKLAPKDKSSKRSSSKRMSDKKKEKDITKAKTDDPSAEVKKSKRSSDRRTEQREGSSEDPERKKKRSSDRRKAKEPSTEDGESELSSRKSSKKSHSREKSAESAAAAETRSDSPSRKKHSKKNMKTL